MFAASICEYAQPILPTAIGGCPVNAIADVVEHATPFLNA